MKQTEPYEGKLIKVGTRIKTTNIKLQSDNDGKVTKCDLTLRTRIPKGYRFDEPEYSIGTQDDPNALVIHIKGDSRDIGRKGKLKTIEVEYPIENWQKIIFEDEVIKYRIRIVFSVFFTDLGKTLNPERSGGSILVGM